MNRRSIPWILAILVLAGLGVDRAVRTPAERGAPPAPRPAYPPFSVTTSSGTLDLADLRGKATVVYFGYTACADICPTTLANVGAALRRLPQPALERTAGLFVSVDPGRDTPENLARYARFFHPRLRAGTADPDRLAEITEDWGVFFRKVGGDSALGYMVDHSTQAFLLDPEGRMVEQLPHGTPPSDIRAAIERVLAP